MDSIGSVTESEESDELLMVLKEPTGCRVSETASEGSTECEGSEGAGTVIEMQQHAQ